MFRIVQSVCASNQSAWNGLQPFVTAHTSFNDKLVLLDQLIYEQGKATVGIRKVKDEERLETGKRANKIANALRVYATTTGNTVLSEQLKFSLSDLTQRSNTEAMQLIGRVVEAASANPDVLAGFVITQQDIDDLIQRHHYLVEAFGSVRGAIVNRTKNTSQIEGLIREITSLLKNTLDPMVELLHDDQPDFAKLYKNARNIVDYKGKKHKGGKEEEDGIPDVLDTEQ